MMGKIPEAGDDWRKKDWYISFLYILLIHQVVPGCVHHSLAEGSSSFIWFRGGRWRWINPWWYILFPLYMEESQNFSGHRTVSSRERINYCCWIFVKCSLTKWCPTLSSQNGNWQSKQIQILGMFTRANSLIKLTNIRDSLSRSLCMDSGYLLLYL
jgi:hypothetical protein